jgi:hypothetical protein
MGQLENLVRAQSPELRVLLERVVRVVRLLHLPVEAEVVVVAVQRVVLSVQSDRTMHSMV